MSTESDASHLHKANTMNNPGEIGQEVVNRTLENKSIEDFEDGLEYYSARNAGCEYIITENPRDFYFSTIPVLRSQDFIIHHAQGLNL